MFTKGMFTLKAFSNKALGHHSVTMRVGNNVNANE